MYCCLNCESFYLSDASKQTSSGTFPWLSHYEGLCMDNPSQPINPLFPVDENHFSTSSVMSRSEEGLDRSVSLRVWGI